MFILILLSQPDAENVLRTCTAKGSVKMSVILNHDIYIDRCPGMDKRRIVITGLPTGVKEMMVKSFLGELELETAGSVKSVIFGTLTGTALVEYMPEHPGRKLTTYVPCI